VILNPMARSENAAGLIDFVRDLVSGDADLVLTQSAGHARQLACAAAKAGAPVVVAAGGDGTVNEVANGIAESDRTETILGVLPVGTMNVFAAELGISSERELAWDTICRGAVREIDLPSVNGHRFVQLAGIGLDAQIVHETPWEMKRHFGPLSYLLTAAEVASRPAPRLVVTMVGREVRGSFVLVGNGRFYGAPIPVFAHASHTDGLLDVIVFQNLGYLDITRYLAGIFTGGNHLNEPDVVYTKCRELWVRTEDEMAQLVPVEVDGEPLGTVPCHFTIPGTVRVVSGGCAV
jgi:YegS/Rv2252/BmrU family lipid kinase